jgi:hypothetical protein
MRRHSSGCAGNIWQGLGPTAGRRRSDRQGSDNNRTFFAKNCGAAVGRSESRRSNRVGIGPGVAPGIDNVREKPTILPLGHLTDSIGI